MSANILIEKDDRGVAMIRMNRAQVHNAFNDALIRELTHAFKDVSDDDDVHMVMLRGEGKSFCAGADLDWMKTAASYSEAQNHADAQRLSEMLHHVNTCPKPVIALVQGAALGGGAGLVACADIVLAVRDARFGFSEVRLGLTPATISPYVLAKIGESAARRYFLTAERFGAEVAREIGLVHETVGSENDLNGAADRVVDQLLAGAPKAQSAAKDLIFTVKNRTIDTALRDETAARIAARRTSREAREGMAAFFEKRKPSWTKEGQ